MPGPVTAAAAQQLDRARLAVARGSRYVRAGERQSEVEVQADRESVPARDLSGAPRESAM